MLEESYTKDLTISDDPYNLGSIKDYRSLASLAYEAQKAFFDLTPADGAVGSLLAAAQVAYWDFQRVARTIAERASIVIHD